MKDDFILLQDLGEDSLCFEKWLYCYLDYDMVVAMILYWYMFDYIFNNPLLAVALTYAVERFFRWLRAELGEANLAKKAMVDDRFLT